MAPGWRDACGPEAIEVCFASTRLDGTWEDQMWEWFHSLAYCGIYVDLLYKHTPWEDSHVNAYLKTTSGQQTPAIRVPNLSLTANWYLSHDGRIRLDGSWSNKPIL
eukprot:1413761-Pyramimonas_sp.AAC.1